MKKLSYFQKINLTGGSAALLAPAIGQAAVVHFDDTHAINVNFSGVTSAEWDVDGGGANDFVLHTLHSFIINLESDGGRNARGMVKTGSGTYGSFHDLDSGFTVGSTLAGTYNWGNSGHDFRSVLYNTGVARSFQGGSLGSNFVGFRFDIDGKRHYGWAELILTISDVSINQWAYNDTEGASINVAQIADDTSSVPEPYSLTLLAMGAAGIVRMRQKTHKSNNLKQKNN